MSEQNENISREEVKKEFQLERMILFSDAVFAIVITLMAIEIRMPEQIEGTEGIASSSLFSHLFPVILAYACSFFFIGLIWYEHLKSFSVLKDYDAGLVIRNLILLFFIGLFPFCATVVSTGKGAVIPMIVYLGIIMVCMAAQYILQHYILIKRPQLRNNTDIQKHLEELEKKRIGLISFAIIIVLVIISLFFIKDESMKSIVMLWMLLFTPLMKILKRKKTLTI